MNPSRITGIRAIRAARTAPQIAACSRPPSAASTASGLPKVSAWRAIPASITRAFSDMPSASDPVPGPTQSEACPPKVARASAAAIVELPMPISPSTSTCAVLSTAAAPRAMASSVSASVIAGPWVKSCVGRSRSSGTTDSSAPFARHIWLMQAPPCSKLATICAVTSCG